MQVIGYGPDWYTATNKLEPGQSHLSLMAVFSAIGGPTKKWCNQGYKGKENLENGIKWGCRPRMDGRLDEILAGSGNGTAVAMDSIERLDAYKTTRFDLQITVRLDSPCPRLAFEQYERLTALRGVGLHVSNGRKLSYVRSETGETMYLGARKTGRKFFRFYDKSADYSADIGTVWRREVQYGRKLAGEAARRYREIAGDHVRIEELVEAEFRGAGFYDLLHPSPAEVNTVQGFGEETVGLDAKINWLKVCVRPTVALLIEHEKEKEMLEALGLRSIRETWSEKRQKSEETSF